ncbi:MAG: NAD-dependent deacetylase, partial [Acinetobacter junii]|nr:NAD-dependent deacetylase [Acinetobacter junii]
ASCTAEIWSGDDISPEIDHLNCQWLDDLPHCKHCGGLARPNILMFDDYEWIAQRQTQQRNRLESFINQYKQPLVIEIGAGTAIPTVRYFSERFAPSLIRINPRDYALPKTGGIALAMNAAHGIQIIYDISTT